MFSVISKVASVDLVISVDCEDSRFTDKNKIIRYRDGAIVEDNVVVRAEAQDIVFRVWPVVWSA